MSQDRDSSPLSALNALDAYVRSFTEHPDAALEDLRGKFDAESVRRRILILIDCDRFEEAARAAQEVAPHEKWVDKAVSALVLSGRLNEAEGLVGWAKQSSDTITWHRCILSFCATAHKKALDRTKAARPIFPEMLLGPELDQLHRLVDAARPVFDLVQARGKIDNELESIVLGYVAHAESLLRNVRAAAAVGELLITRKPIPLIVIEIILMRAMKARADIVERIRGEHRGNTIAELHAALIEGEHLGRPREAWEAAFKLTAQCQNAEEKLEACRLLLELSQFLSVDHLSRTQKITEQLLPSDHKHQAHIRVVMALATQRYDDAAAILDATRDESNAQWLQTQAAYLEETGNPSEALRYLSKAVELLPHPELVRRVAGLAFQQKEFEISRKALERLSSLIPGGKEVFQNLAVVYVELSDWRHAAEQFLKLRELDPANDEHVINAAFALTRAGEVDAALALYDTLCGNLRAPLQAHVARAMLRKSAGEAKRAFDDLAAIKQDHWHDPEFLTAYYDLGFAAGDEAEAHEAMLHLRRLQLLGKADSDIIREHSLEEFQQFVAARKTQVEELSRSNREGKVPWLMADAWLGGRSPYWCWRLRTQNIAWLPEDSNLTAQRSIYATNGFSAFSSGERREIRQLRCPDRGADIVIDLTALMTLHRLGLLSAASAYFGSIAYPATYQAVWVAEIEHLTPHQLSRVNTIRAIRKAVDANEMSVVKRDEKTTANVVEVSEYASTTDEEGGPYGISDLLVVLKQEGLVTAEDITRISAVLNRSRPSPGSRPELVAGRKIAIDTPTLFTLSEVSALEPAAKAFEIVIPEEDYARIVSESVAFDAQEETSRWQKELRSIIRNDRKFIELLPSTPPEWSGEGEQTSGFSEAFLSAAFIAIKEQLPLLADDRICQAFVLNQRPEDQFASFGTDRLIESLVHAGLITWNDAAGYYLRLIGFRYRFIFMPDQAILNIIRRYVGQIPGDLRRLASYIHNCMQDAGLFAGEEPTTVPTNLASQSYQLFLFSACDVIGETWLDKESFSRERATELTRWIVSELFPTPPSVLGRMGVGLCSISSRLILGRILMRLVPLTDYSRAQECLKCLEECLGISHKELQRMSLEIIDGF